MPRQMPALALSFRTQKDEALGLAEAAERIRVSVASSPSLRQELTLNRIHLIYEMSFLRFFALWETFLEESFLRYLCGYVNSNGPQTLLTSGTSKNLHDAKALLFGNRQFLLWHNPKQVTDRCKSYFHRGLHDAVISSSHARLEWFSSIRHRIAHDQDDAKNKFDLACINLCGRRFSASRPGPLLREWTTVGGQRTRWLNAIGNELCDLADQITP